MTKSSDSQLIPITSIDDFRNCGELFIDQFRQTLWVYAHDLAPALFSRKAITGKITRVATTNRRAEIRLLVKDVHPLVKYDHPLIETSRRLSSFIEIRELPESIQIRDELLILTDETGWLRLEPAETFQGRYCVYDPIACRELKKRFDRMWEESTRPADVLRLHL